MSFWAGFSACASADFEDLDNLVPAQLLAVVLDQDRVGERVGLEIVDSQHAHELALDGLAELGLAVDDRVLEPQAPGQLVLDLPVRDDRAVSEVANLAPGVTDRRDRSDGHAEGLERWRPARWRGAVFTHVAVGMRMAIGTGMAVGAGMAVGLMSAVGRMPCGDSTSL